MRRGVWVGFAVLCLISGSTWLADGLFISTWPSLLRLGFHDGVVCLCLVAWSVARRGGGLRWIAWEAAVWGGVLFALPVLLVVGAGESVRSATELLVVALVPFLTVFMVAQSDGGESRLLMPAVASVGGLALIFPLGWPTSAVGWGWLAAMVVSAGVMAWAGMRMHRVMQTADIVWSATLGSGAAAVVSLVSWKALQGGGVDWGVGTVGVEIGWGVLVDGPLVLLTFWLLREMRPVGFSTRYLLALPVTVMDGMAMMRSGLPWSTWLGLVLAVGGSWVMLQGSAEEGSLVDR